MHVALALGAAAVLVGLGLTLAYIDPPGDHVGVQAPVP